MNNASIANPALHQFKIQSVGRLSLLIQTWILPQDQFDFSPWEECHSYLSISKMPFWGGFYPKTRVVLSKIYLYTSSSRRGEPAKERRLI
ncbi:hypothetical protein PPSC2_25560 (plasmid) [Paenibacillus polymyxa SC2]|uniref:Uncharacterized protein n=1 Tax=Paenibacillus polymyxa (strain SC2) TaxID=886882 RepID=A0A0D5ZCP8_PAEPS|nr:hypothetical protein PPSC2_25560 [Paenibacillus polymyxa SC2]